MDLMQIIGKRIRVKGKGFFLPIYKAVIRYLSALDQVSKVLDSVVGTW